MYLVQVVQELMPVFNVLGMNVLTIPWHNLNIKELELVRI